MQINFLEDYITRRHTSVVGLLAVLLFGIVCLSVFAQGEESFSSRTDDRFTFRVLSYNIRHCQGTDDALNVQRIANVINAANPDIVSLQEVDNRTLRSLFVDQAAELGRLTGMYHRFGKAINYQGGEYGQAILSRWPIDDFDVHLLPTEAGQEQRIAIVATIIGDTHRPTIVFAGTHLHAGAESLRLPQAVRLISVLRGYDTRGKILSGDMNATPSSQTMQTIRNDWVDTTPDNAFTIPSDVPNRKIDYIMLAKGHAWRVVQTEVINEPVASDHRPVLTVLEWAGGDTLAIR
jgi:endonuclease/exonuclease/phosphatase family metal-dependent hydrolase